MAGNTFGNLFRVTTFGVTRPCMGALWTGACGTCALRGLHPAGIGPAQAGQSKLTTPRKESTWSKSFLASPPVTRAHHHGRPLGFILRNNNAKPSDYSHLENTFRPSHADFTYEAKYGLRKSRRGRASPERRRRGWWQAAWPGNSWRRSASRSGPTWSGCKTSACPCLRRSTAETRWTPTQSGAPIPDTARRMAERIEEVRQAGDTVGGAVVLVARACQRLGRTGV